MDTITGVRDLDMYLVTFFDQHTIYNYSILSKETNRIATNHPLFRTLKEYYETRYEHEEISRWAVRNDKLCILDWYTKRGHKFENTFAVVNMAIIYDSTKILDWFYQRNIFDYVLISLHQAVLTGSFKSIDWFYEHGLEKIYLDKTIK